MGKNVTIATKVTEETRDALDELSKANGMTIYEMVQNAILTILRLGNKTMRLTPIMMENWSQFENLFGSQSIANITTIRQDDIDIQDAIYRIRQNGKSRSSMLLMRRPFFDNADVSIDNNKILDIVLSTGFNSTYRMLDSISREHHLPNVMTAISWLISQYADEQMEREIADMFSDNDITENGRRMPKQEYVRHNHITMARYEQRQIIQQADMFSQMEDDCHSPEDGGELEMQRMRKGDGEACRSSHQASGRHHRH